ncbi:DUF3798 domain-containing protein [Romboutsia weinsteinii]|uniref:DUF3798 domain-containing protein n=1 Tax=Romboutsia weinsteinii TaxID=2020949 RepID=A0A371J747_9FIRM|nr:DUF3798 domain-containing protein [Romboutsia weinsteinii]RDY28592.1 DUF3798 domain-containing protein [Romboutsia weinsteinii]
MKKITALMLALCLLVGTVGCSSTGNSESGGTDSENTEKFKVGIVTPTLSVSEDEFRGATNMVDKYPDNVVHVTLPENFNTEIETAISQIVSLADDEDMKAIVVVSGQSGLLPALQQVKEKRSDIITMTAPIWDDPDMMSEYIDVNLDANWAKRGETIVKLAKKMGSKTFIHYSFPTHLSKESVAKRRDMMKETCEKEGIEFVEVITPDPQTGQGPAAMQQFLSEDIPRQIEKYGPETNIFGSNCGMYEVILSKALELKYTVAEQCCPTPTQAYPTVMNLEIDEEDSQNFDKINEMISEKAKEADMSGRLGGWPMPMTVFLPEFAVELAMEMVSKDLNKEDVCTSEYLQKFAQDKYGIAVEFEKLKDETDNYQLMIMEQIVY